jgi:hypothetical protein
MSNDHYCQIVRASAAFALLFFSGALHNMAYMGGLSPSVQCDICV